MSPFTFRFTAPLWIWSGAASWYFITLPFDVTDAIDEISAESTRGFGSVRVSATIGNTIWTTSIFPSKEHKSFILPVKAKVRTAEHIGCGDKCEVELGLVDFG
jgi:hypothetical protein